MTTDVEFLLRFFGAVQIEQRGAPIQGLGSRKGMALLAYLVLSGQPVSRSLLTALIWPELGESRALNNLSWIVSQIGRTLPRCIAADRYTLRFQPSEQISADVLIVERLLSRPEPEALREGLALYRGEFMQGFYLNDCPEFETWMLSQRERLQGQAISALEQQLRYERARGDYREALVYATQLLQLDPYHEETQRTMMSLLVLDGQRHLALAQYERCRRLLADDLGIEPEEATTMLYERIRAAEPLTSEEQIPPALRQPLAPGTAVPTPAPADLALMAAHSFPTPNVDLVGREQELAELERCLASDSKRLITISGPGGMGKTSLALALVERVGSLFAHGAYVVPLAPVTTRDAMIFAIMHSLNLVLINNSDPTRQVLDVLAGKELLLVLDNFEQLVDQSLLLVELLSQAPHLRILVTSRERLNLRVEQVFELEGLALASEEGASAGLPASAVRLFETRAQQVQHRFALTPETLPAVEAICRLVGGSPLGIELAATWADRLSPAAILRAIQSSADALITSMHDVPERHRSIRAVFDHSWQLLAQSERQTLARLAVFRGSFDLEAMQAVTPDALDQLSRLARASLVRSVGTERYELHELVRYYALEQLQADQTQGWAQAYQQHSAHFLGRVAAAQAALFGQHPLQALAQLRQDLDNIRQAWQWASEHMRWQELGSSLEGMRRFYELSFLSAEAELAFERAAQQLEQQLASKREQQPALLALLLQLRAAQIAALVALSRFDPALALLTEALDLARQQGLDEQEALLEAQWSEILLIQGQYRQAEQLTGQILTTARRLDLHKLEAQCYSQLGRMCYLRSDFSQAQPNYEAALRIYRQLGDRIAENRVMLLLGTNAWMLGSYPTARMYAEQALKNYQEIGSAYYVAMAQHYLCNALWALGEYQHAKNLLETALQATREFGAQRGVMAMLCDLSKMRFFLGAYAEAGSCALEGLQLAREFGSRRPESILLTRLSLALYAQGNWQGARAYSQQAYEVACQIGSGSEQADALISLGHSLLKLGQLEAAAEAYQQSLEWRMRMGQRQLTTDALAGLTLVALEREDPAAALGFVEQILQQLASSGTDGLEDPAQIYLICYKVLHYHDDSRAPKLLAQAYRWLEQVLRQLSDPVLRRSFLEMAVSQRELRAYTKHYRQPQPD